MSNPELIGVEFDGGEVVARFRVEQVWRLSPEAARHVGVLLVRATDPKPAPPPLDDDPV